MIGAFVRGFSITLKHALQHVKGQDLLAGSEQRVTVQYPEERRPLPQFQRGKHYLLRYSNGLERCVCCGLCAAACPSEAIYMEAAENSDEHRVSPGERYAKVYQIHLLRCIYCGFCEEACPENAIVMGNDFEYAADSRLKFIANKEDMLVPADKGHEGFHDFGVRGYGPWADETHNLETDPAMEGKRAAAIGKQYRYANPDYPQGE